MLIAYMVSSFALREMLCVLFDHWQLMPKVLPQVHIGTPSSKKPNNMSCRFGTVSCWYHSLGRVS